MTEAWLLVEETAIREAAGNPNGHVVLDLPPLRRLEDIPDPKRFLRELLLDASGRTGARRRKRMKRDLPRLVYRVATLIGDYSRLNALSAYRAFRADLGAALARRGHEGP